MRTAWQVSVCMMILIFVPELTAYDMKTNRVNFRPNLINSEIQGLIPYVTDEQYIHHIHAMVNAYSNKDDIGGRLVIQTNAQIDTKYRTWKRNADLINSLLALPKGMNEAGR